MVNSLANNVMNLLVPALPQMVKNHVSKSRLLAYGDGIPCRARVGLQAGANRAGSPWVISFWD